MARPTPQALVVSAHPNLFLGADLDLSLMSICLSDREMMKKRFAALITSVGILFSGSITAAHTSDIRPVANGYSEVFPLASAPCTVYSYSWHAKQEMAADSITEPTVQDVVYSTYNRATRQANGTWKYNGRTIVVIMNTNHNVVTVWRK